MHRDVRKIFLLVFRLPLVKFVRNEERVLKFKHMELKELGFLVGFEACHMIINIQLSTNPSNVEMVRE